MRQMILLFLLGAVGGAIAGAAPTNAVATISAPTNAVAGVAVATNYVTKAVRNPFWPIGYTGEWARISSEVRPKPKPKPPAPKPKVDAKKIEADRLAAAQAAAEKAAKEATAAQAAAKAAAETAAKEKAAAEKAAKEAAKPREITSANWRAAQKALKFGNPALFKAEDGTVRSSININGNIYVDGDLMSFTHDGIRFTWRIQGLDGKDKKLKLKRVQARLAEQPTKTEQKKTGGGK